jgi:ribonuclease-3
MMVGVKAFLGQYISPDKKLITSIKNITGFFPHNLRIYKIALTHKTASAEIKEGVYDSNERLEFLGDAILGGVIADFLYKKFPFKDEGFLTKLRSRIVSRENLNKVSIKFGLNEMIDYHFQNRNIIAKSMNGDALEAFIGAIYLDRGFETCKQFIIHQIIKNHIDLDLLEVTDKDFKSQLVEWTQRHKKKFEYKVIAEHGKAYDKYYDVQLFIDEEPQTIGKGKNKKSAEQAAAEAFLKENT